MRNQLNDELFNMVHLGKFSSFPQKPLPNLSEKIISENNWGNYIIHSRKLGDYSEILNAVTKTIQQIEEMFFENLVENCSQIIITHFPSLNNEGFKGAIIYLVNEYLASHPIKI